VLRPRGIPVGTTSLGGPRWPEYLEELLRSCEPDFVALNPYGWIFDGLDSKIASVESVAMGLPIKFPELGCKIGDAGDEVQHADALRIAAALVEQEGIDAAWFAWHDLVGAPDERGPSAFGLVAEDGRRRPSWSAFAALAEVPKPVTPPVVVPAPPEVSVPQPMTRDEVIALIVSKAEEYGLVPWELLGGAIAESGLNHRAERLGTPPDVSFGLFQQTARYAPEGNLEGDLDHMRELYFDPVHATDVAAANYRGWRYDPEVPAEQAWCAYNWPGSYSHYTDNPNLDNYRAGLEEAQQILGVSTVSDPAPRVTFDATFPPTIQDDDWSCAPSSLDWALRALGRQPGHSYIENLLVHDGVVSTELGLLDASGTQLAAWIGKKVPAEVYYGSDGFYGNNEAEVSFDAVASEIGPYPLLLGGRNWGGPGLGHWVGVRGYDRARDVLTLANPAGTSGSFGGQTLSRGQFSQRGPYSMVRVLHPDLLATDPPVVTPAPVPPRADVLRAEIETRLDELVALASRS
jgi:hypothetical protein